MYCKHCGAEVNDQAVICVHCGCSLTDRPVEAYDPNRSDKEWLVTMLLCFFLGCLGIHSFYVGRTGRGIAQLLTCGGCGVWALIDFIVILLGNFKDHEGKTIANRL